ncbi:MAG: radical SAM family heme chaperone HemW [Coriobacteriaceae bacterium]|nr:radical SAM family heme chaperone HemW [Coriobacteriaceae bacterium]
MYRALYLHIPFCKAKCAYCDFESRAVGEGRAFDAAVAAYVERLAGLIDQYGRAGKLAQVETVYIGGGTPSLLGQRLPRVAERVRLYCDPVEFTCEANPESFTPELASGLRSVGVTRISLGVQSLQSGELRAIGRIHTAERALEAIALAKQTGFSTSCDLMCGLPLQTAASWCDTLARTVEADPDHVSVYPLQLEDGTSLARREEAGEVVVPDEDFQAACMDAARELLEAAGYERYEVASYAKPGHRCRHNIAYWTGKPYLGLGRSAASMKMRHLGSDPKWCILGERERFVQLDDAGEQFEREILTAREAVAEDLMLACRMTDGISAELLKRAAAVIAPDALERACGLAVSRGLARWSPSTSQRRALVPTHAGWLEGNELYGIFWGLADE